ncbi:GIY-YIG nuclease family protein [Aquicoccus sp. SU-CL01552]|uniref:GIY-YIG nuclease family protein n=1 Tax=Aquicoccus sp. SU-CL01552 TaxID=3127656 RepID=UPI00310A1467
MQKPKRKLTRSEKIMLFSAATSMPIKPAGKTPPPEQKHEMGHWAERANYLNRAQAVNGPGFYLDRKVREFVLEYNNRVFSGYGSQQPVSFQVLREFVEPDDAALVLKILPEKHYSLDPNYVLDCLTDPSIKRRPSDLYQLDEAVNYMVSMPGGYDDLQLSGLKDFGLFGWAFVRHGDEVSVFALGARPSPKRDVEAIPVEQTNIDPRKPFLRDSIGATIDPNLDEFFDRPELYPLMLMSKIDLRRGNTVVRYVLIEKRQSFDVVTDSREMYTDMVKNNGQLHLDQISELFDRSWDALAEYAPAFSLMNELPHTIIGIEDVDDFRIVRTPTDIRLDKSSTQVRRMKKVLHPSEAPNFVDVGTLILPNRPATVAEVDTEAFRIEQHGYWKQLRSDQSGEGKNGDTVIGKTWVTVTETWQEAFGSSPPENSKTVTVKTGTDAEQTGELYVMRSAQHPKDVYKIGYTTKTADERARQLESTSGQPDQFAVVNSWKVKQPRRVEGIVHDYLARYRTNPRREFFKVKYAKIQSAIEEIIADLDAATE